MSFLRFPLRFAVTAWAFNVLSNAITIHVHRSCSGGLTHPNIESSKLDIKLFSHFCDATSQLHHLRVLVEWLVLFIVLFLQALYDYVNSQQQKLKEQSKLESKWQEQLERVDQLLEKDDKIQTMLKEKRQREEDAMTITGMLGQLKRSKVDAIDVEEDEIDGTTTVRIKFV